MAFPVTCSTPSAAALAEYLPTVYSLGHGSSDEAGRVECFFASQGWGDVYLVQRWDSVSGEAERYFLKVYAAGWRSVSDIRFELDFVQHLDRKGLSVALPLPGRDGSLVHSLELPEGERSLVLFHAAPGRPLSEQSAEVQNQILGDLAAQFHLAAGDFTSPHPRLPLDLDHLLDLSPLETFASQRGKEMAYLQHVAERVRAALYALPLTALRRGVCHGDLGGYQGRTTLDEVEVAAAPCFALARLLQVHAHDNPVGAMRDRWPASGYVDGTQWDWLLQAVRALESHLPRH